MSKFLRTLKWKTNSKHKKLPEDIILNDVNKEEYDDTSANDNEDVVIFKLKYLGSTIVEKVQHQEHLSIEAVNTILKNVKTTRRKPQRVSLSVSLRGLSISDQNNEELFKVSIYRISNCCMNPSQIFSFIATDCHETTECHAFMCQKRRGNKGSKMGIAATAETVTLAVAHAFSMAYEQWRVRPDTLKFAESAIQAERRQLNNQLEEIMPEKRRISDGNDVIGQRQRQLVEQQILIDFETAKEENALRQTVNNDITNMTTAIDTFDKWVSFDDNNYGNYEIALI